MKVSRSRITDGEGKSGEAHQSVADYLRHIDVQKRYMKRWNIESPSLGKFRSKEAQMARDCEKANTRIQGVV